MRRWLLSILVLVGATLCLSVPSFGTALQVTGGYWELDLYLDPGDPMSPVEKEEKYVADISVLKDKPPASLGGGSLSNSINAEAFDSGGNKVLNAAADYYISAFEIKAGRHPVVEAALQAAGDGPFYPGGQRLPIQFSPHNPTPFIIPDQISPLLQVLQQFHHKERMAAGLLVQGLPKTRIEPVRFCVQQAIDQRCGEFLVEFRQGKGQQRPARLRAHRRQVAEIDGQRLVADIPGVGIGEEMHARVQGIGGDHRRFPGGDFQDRGVVADAQPQSSAATGSFTDAVDEFEFSHWAVPCLAQSGDGESAACV